MSHCLQDGEDLVTPWMSPPASLDGPADDRLRQARNGALARDEDHALLPDKCHCLVGGHARTWRRTRRANRPLRSRQLSCFLDQPLKKREKNAANADRLLGSNSGATST